MNLSSAKKQRITFATFLILAIIATHFIYQLLNPEWILFRKAETEYENKQWEKAIVFYEESLSKGLKTPVAMQRIANAYTELKNYPKAIYWYRNYIKLRPKDIWARRALAGLLTANGEFDEASKEYQWILKHQSEMSPP